MSHLWRPSFDRLLHTCGRMPSSKLQGLRMAGVMFCMGRRQCSLLAASLLESELSACLWRCACNISSCPLDAAGIVTRTLLAFALSVLVFDSV